MNTSLQLPSHPPTFPPLPGSFTSSHQQQKHYNLPAPKNQCIQSKSFSRLEQHCWPSGQVQFFQGTTAQGSKNDLVCLVLWGGKVRRVTGDDWVCRQREGMTAQWGQLVQDANAQTSTCTLQQKLPTGNHMLNGDTAASWRANRSMDPRTE